MSAGTSGIYFYFYFFGDICLKYFTEHFIDSYNFIMHIHFIGIGGIAMGNFAAMLKQMGYTLSGSDAKLYPPMSTFLAEQGIEVLPYDKKNVQEAELVIVGNALSRGNVEIEALLNESIPHMSMAAAFAHFCLGGSTRNIVVAGTHGKTTTSFLMDFILEKADKQGITNRLIGGIRGDGQYGFSVSSIKDEFRNEMPNKIPRNTRNEVTQKQSYFVTEGDEYDTAFFDKTPKFMHYKPYYLILNNIEFDHADIYRDLQDYIRAFANLIRLVPSQGCIVANMQDPNVRDILHNYTCAPIHAFSPSNKSNKEACFSFSPKTNVLKLSFIEQSINLAHTLLGEHNASNATAAALMSKKLGVSDKVIIEALETFPGVLRRQQLRLDRKTEKFHLQLIEDFAHHPSSVSANIDALRKKHPESRIHVFFEPRSATSHRNIFQKEYTHAFSKANSIYITEVYNTDKVSEQEKLQVEKMIPQIKELSQSKDVYYCKTPHDLLVLFQKNFKPHVTQDIVLVLSNGSFGNIYTDLENFLKNYGGIV